MANEIELAEIKPLSAADIRSQVNLIQEVMKAVMQEGQHYGRIPGAGDKPTLLKPGAEKIMATFRLSVDPEIEDLSHDDIIRYRIKCKLISVSGRMVGAGVGECSTEEEKFKWRAIVSGAEWNAIPETHRRIKYKQDGEIKQVRTNPYDLANTVLKMAKKRALVDAVLTTTAASDIFTQDIEDMEEIINQKGQKTPIQQPQSKSQKAPETPPQAKEVGGVSTIQTGIENVTMKSGGTKEKPWTRYTIHAKEQYHTFDKKIAEEGKRAKEAGLEVLMEYKSGQYGLEIISLSVIEPREPGQDG